MANETKVLTAHVPLGLAEKVEAMAARLERSRGWVMKQALAAWVDQEEERHRMTLEALAAATYWCSVARGSRQATCGLRVTVRISFIADRGRRGSNRTARAALERLISFVNQIDVESFTHASAAFGRHLREKAR